jgi:hypothetical protein
MTDSIFLLRCVDCDARGLLSRLWLRASIEARRGKSLEVHRYVECMNCGAHLKSRQHDLMERVDDEEWARFVGDESGRAGAPVAAATQRIN